MSITSRRLPAALTTVALASALLTPASAVAAETVYLASDSVLGGPTGLYEVDLAVNEATFLLTFGFAAQIHAITICPGSSTLYAIGKENMAVSAVDLAAVPPAETLVGSLPASFRNGVVQFSCSPDGTLYLTHMGTDKLFTLDLATCPACTPLLVGQVETAPGAADIDLVGADIYFTPTGELFLLTNGNGHAFYRVEPVTALASFVGLVTTGGTSTGLTLTGAGRLVISNSNDHFYELDPSDASSIDLGTLTEGGLPLNIRGGDLASIPPLPGGSEGCTPGYWKQDHHFGSWVGYRPDDDYETVFGVDASFQATLLEALRLRGGGERALARHAVAALLNAANPEVDYFTTVLGVITLVQEAYASGDFESTKDLLDSENNLGCPLGRSFADEFGDGSLPSDWTFERGAWGESGGHLRGAPDGSAGLKVKARAIAEPAYAGCDLCTIEAVVQASELSGAPAESHLRLLGWYSGKGTNVSVTLKPAQDKVVFQQKQDRTTLVRETASLAIDAERPYQLKVHFDGVGFQVYLDGVRIFDEPVASGFAPHGTFGFQTRGAAVSVDRVAVF